MHKLIRPLDAGDASRAVSRDRMTEFQRLTNQNAYLKQRCAQLQDDLTDVIAENVRLRQMLDRMSVPNVLAAHAR